MEPQLAAYIERGDVQFVYMHRIVAGADSQRAAEAVECAADQGYFWAYHDKLFEVQASGAFTAPKLKGYAADLGLDTAAFDACLDSGRHTELVHQQDAEAIAAGIQGTPNFVIGNQLVPGLPPVEALLDLIDAELAKR